MKKQLEQSSEVSANNLPEIPKHIELCNRLMAQEPLETNPIPETRCFYGPDGSVFIGIVLKETEDSFLVGASAKMMMTKTRQVSSEPITGEAVLRIFKSSIRYVVMPQELTIYHYYSFLEDFGYKHLPDYFTEERKQYISSVRNNPKFQAGFTAETLEDDTVEDNLDIPGASKFAWYSPTASESIN